MTSPLNRRDMLKTSAMVGAGVWLGTTPSSAGANSPNEKLNIAFIGVGGRGEANWKGLDGQNVVALCDVDEVRGARAYEKYPGAKRFSDYRVMFDKIEKEIDAVVVSTPDHTHFHPSMAAMSLGKHLYCEKPMAHSVWEIRAMTELAKRNRLATQLGVQRHTLTNMHRVVELIKSGAIGEVNEVHSWVSSERGMPDMPQEYPPIPSTMQWDLWVGPAKFRKYTPAFAPYNWRFWWDYGTGETGNWGCHILDIPFWALDLKYPTRVEGSGPEADAQRTPKSMATRFEFPGNEQRGPVVLHWSQAKGGPAILKELGIEGNGNNLFIGSKGMLLCSFDKLKLLPEEKYADFKAPEPFIEDSPGFHNEWVTACKGGPAATCDFIEYSGPLAETVILGNVAYRAGGGFDWDHQTLTAEGNEKAQAQIRTEYRKGWEFTG